MKVRCPICQTEAVVPDDYEFRPFCSSRCKIIDLGNWLEGRYTLPREISAEELDRMTIEERHTELSDLLVETEPGEPN